MKQIRILLIAVLGITVCCNCILTQLGSALKGYFGSTSGDYQKEERPPKPEENYPPIPDWPLPDLEENYPPITEQSTEKENKPHHFPSTKIDPTIPSKIQIFFITLFEVMPLNFVQFVKDTASTSECEVQIEELLPTLLSIKVTGQPQNIDNFIQLLRAVPSVRSVAENTGSLAVPK